MNDDQDDPLRAWLGPRIDQGWLNADLLTRLDSLERQRAETLFRDRQHRPLLVALFGGTGVGKSSLLNRLAGQPIARTGLQRPTSLEVTLYLHRDFQLDLLPPELPMQHTRIAYHDEPQRRLLAWIDMPDMDSTTLANRQLVEAWLPYIDWIIYVVSPERYHDDLGWRFLQRRGRRHAWLFVINHWDQGRPEQLEDLRQRLINEGFTAPVLLRSSCLPDQPEDDFDQLEQQINRAIQQHSLELLQQLGISARREDRQRLLNDIANQLGDDAAWQQANQQWMQRLQTGLARFRQELLTLAQRQIVQLGKDLDSMDRLPAHIGPLADGLSQTRESQLLADLRLQLLNGLTASGVPMDLFEQALPTDLASSQQLQQHLLEQLHLALDKPGHWLRRGLYQLNHHLEWLLPLAASGWAIQHALAQFYLGTRQQGDFLGLDFAIHALLLIGLGWLIPRLLRHRLAPRPKAVLRQGIQAGLDALTTEISARQQQMWQAMAQQRSALLEEIRHFRTDAGVAAPAELTQASAYWPSASATPHS